MENVKQVMQKMSGGSLSIIHGDFKQRSPEWYQIRLGRIGGTDAESLAVKGKNQYGLGTGIMSTMYKKIYEVIQNQSADDSGYISAAMERGIELEPLAVQEYEKVKFETVIEIGYVSLGYFFGYSPDGFIGEDGLIEVKCPGAAEYIRLLSTDEIQSGYIWQMQWGMFMTNRDWCDFVAYNPDFKPMPLYIKRVEKDMDAVKLLYDQGMKYLDAMDVVLGKIRKR
jgi:hypothetical protein